MTRIPESVKGEPIPGLDLAHRGKVRNTYRLLDDMHLLVEASNRVSIFDHVLAALVQQKGEVLTAMNVFWRTEVMGERYQHDLRAYGNGIDAFLPPELRGNPALQARCTVVRRLKMLPVEAVVRGCITGTGLNAYQKTGEVCGHTLPPGLQDGDRLETPLFTPTTKAVVGHDEHWAVDEVRTKFGQKVEQLSLQLFTEARDFAAKQGIILADTKFECGYDEQGVLRVADEVLTPDSSRFWDIRQWLAAQAKAERKSPQSYDKQFVREWGKTCGIDNAKKPEIDSDVDWVHAQVVPAQVLLQTTRLYRYIFWRLTGRKLEAFQRNQMGIDVQVSKPHIVVISGSDSDVPQMLRGLRNLRDWTTNGTITSERHEISCHRHPEELAQIVRGMRDDAVVIAGAGMAAQLPGVLKSLLIKAGKSHVPVIGHACEGKTDSANMAAKLSMEELPNQPVVLDSNGKAYFGEVGFVAACQAAVSDEFPPTTFGIKPAQLNAPLVPDLA